MMSYLHEIQTVCNVVEDPQMVLLSEKGAHGVSGRHDSSHKQAQICGLVNHCVVQSLVVQLEEAAKQARLQACKLQEAVAANSPTAAAATAAAEGTAETSPGKGSSRGSLPGLQDLKGSWSGAFQAYGGGGGAANTDFDVKGTDWQWGNYSMEQV